MFCRKWNRTLIAGPILVVILTGVLKKWRHSSTPKHTTGKIIHCPLVSTVLLYSLVHSGLCLSKKLIGILLHLDVQMKQNTIQLLRQTETAVY